MRLLNRREVCGGLALAASVWPRWSSAQTADSVPLLTAGPVRSQLLAARSRDALREEIIPVFAGSKEVKAVTEDNGIRPDSSLGFWCAADNFKGEAGPGVSRPFCQCA